MNPNNPLAAALAKQGVPQQSAPPAAEPPLPKPPRRPAKKQLPVYLPIPVHEWLRRFAFESRRSMHSVLLEGLDRVIRDHGTSIDELVKGGENA